MLAQRGLWETLTVAGISGKCSRRDIWEMFTFTRVTGCQTIILTRCSKDSCLFNSVISNLSVSKRI